MIKPSEWTNGGDEVFVVRCMSRDGKTSSKRLKNGVCLKNSKQHYGDKKETYDKERN